MHNPYPQISGMTPGQWFTNMLSLANPRLFERLHQQWRIPEMTNPLGKHWNQPVDLYLRIDLYETHVVMDEEDFYKLSNYRTTKPSGVYPGKIWRTGPFLAWYGPIQHDARGEFCNAIFRRVLFRYEKPAF